MKSQLIFSILFTLSLFSFSQKTYKSTYSTKYKVKYVDTDKNRNITISDSKISITNFIGEAKTLLLHVDSVIEKTDKYGQTKKWYYCTTLEKDVINKTNTKFIVTINSVRPISIDVHQIVDELTIIKTSLGI